MAKTDFLNLSKEAYEASTTWVDANIRADWDYSLRAFRNEHASGSKFMSPEYQGRSKVFFPKTRSVIRKNEAAAAIALFSNMETVDITPGNPDDLTNVAAASCIKELVEYRLSRTIPAFLVVMGAMQDAQNTGAVISYNYWEYQTRNGKKVKDKPCITLRPVENIGFDAGADWLDPVNTSPYFFDIIPMYVCDVKAMMASKDDKTGAPKWKKYSDDIILKATPDVMNSTRRARQGGFQDPHEEKSSIKAFDIVWVFRWCMRDGLGDDYCYYTLGTETMLSEEKPLEKTYFHGVRPYTMGYAILETHRAHKTSVPTLIKPLQQASNTLGNQRFDNVQFVLNKRWIVARGRQTDVQSLVRNVPGGVTLTSDPNTDVKESNWVDVTSSSYVEHDRFNAALDELAGNFSPNTRVANNAVNDTLGGSRMANQSAGVMTDYLIRTVIESWWEPTLRQLVLLEQYYETDEVVLGVCERKARLFPRFGISRLTDEMLMQGVNVNVNVGMGASNPAERFQRFIVATKAATELVNTAPPGFNVNEGIKEIYSNAGYRDGARFINENGGDPRLLKAMQMVQQLGQALKGKGLELQAQGQMEQQKLASNERQKAAELQVDQYRISGDLRIREAELLVEQQKLEVEKIKLEIALRGSDQELQIRAVEMQKDIEAAELKLQGEREKQAAQAVQAQHDIEKSALEVMKTKAEIANEARIGDVAEQVTTSMRGVGAEIDAIKKALGSMSSVNAEIGELRKGLGAVFGLITQPKKKMKSFSLKKPDGKKTAGVVVTFDDGSTEELTVN